MYTMMNQIQNIDTNIFVIIFFQFHRFDAINVQRKPIKTVQIAVVHTNVSMHHNILPSSATVMNHICPDHFA